MSAAPVIIIIGLRRSGTTAFWRTLRNDKRLVAYDEPFNPDLRLLPEDNGKGTWREYREVFRRSPEDFWKRFSPIYDLQELDSAFTPQQEAWFRYLVNGSPALLSDLTRCHLKLEALKALAPDSHLVHLYRRAGAFATSHLLPSGVGSGLGSVLHGGAKHLYYRQTFWTRRSRFNFWHLESIIGRHPLSPFGLMLQAAGFDSETIMHAPAVVRLLAYWLFHHRRVEADGQRLWGPRFHSVPFEEFAEDPSKVIRGLYEVWGGDPPPIAPREIVAPRGALQATDQRWARAARVAGFRRTELACLV